MARLAYALVAAAIIRSFRADLDAVRREAFDRAAAIPDSELADLYALLDELKRESWTWEAAATIAARWLREHRPDVVALPAAWESLR